MGEPLGDRWRRVEYDRRYKETGDRVASHKWVQADRRLGDRTHRGHWYANPADDMLMPKPNAAAWTDRAKSEKSLLGRGTITNAPFATKTPSGSNSTNSGRPATASDTRSVGSSTASLRERQESGTYPRSQRLTFKDDAKKHKKAFGGYYCMEGGNQHVHIKSSPTRDADPDLPGPGYTRTKYGGFYKTNSYSYAMEKEHLPVGVTLSPRKFKI
eukprot:gnl/MRDRNA2_/MRDRNA2_105338_c0_seq1.p1 gnl/MRDRNA2_/MRDRNA2_105338_c0~~gnl/MRDRNA2_/MRDRNA2_105338_c0_seq1.p1  ORF type:complete len:214 (-),score=31.23 gnl/MRDRNA2_/MRDRNA2_105338_c0_seq1:45-686(-)